MPRLSSSSSSLARASRVRTTSRTLSRLSRSASKDDGIAMSRAHVLQTRAFGAFSPAQNGHGVDMTLAYRLQWEARAADAAIRVPGIDADHVIAGQTHHAAPPPRPRGTGLHSKPWQPSLLPRQPPCKRPTQHEHVGGHHSIRGARSKTGPASGRLLHRLRGGLRATPRDASHPN